MAERSGSAKKIIGIIAAIVIVVLALILIFSFIGAGDNETEEPLDPGTQEIQPPPQQPNQQDETQQPGAGGGNQPQQETQLEGGAETNLDTTQPENGQNNPPANRNSGDQSQ